MTAAVLFGAGASFACANVSPRPPLGYELFERLASDGVAAHVPHDIRATFLTKGFEEGMAQLHTQLPELVVSLQCQIAVYFLNLKAVGPTVYEHFVRALGDRAASTVWGTLNYDLLLEEAVHAVFGAIDYGFSGEGIRPGIIKLHGSANFRVRGSERIRGIRFAAARNASIEDGELLPMRPQDAIQCFSDPLESIGPLMSLFMEDKPTYACPKAIEAHRRTWFETIERATAILIVGAAYNPADAHVWRSILAAKAPIGIVDPRGEEMVSAIAADGRPDARFVASAFEVAAFTSMRAFLHGT